MNDFCPLPVMASLRTPQWALLEKLSTRSNQGNADGLSRLPNPETPGHARIPADVVLVLNQIIYYYQSKPYQVMME